MDTPDADDRARLVRIYLQDHFAGSTAGLALAQRCREANAGTELGTLLAGLEREIAEDRQALESIMARLDLQPSRVKSAVGAVAERVGRLKLNGRLTSYSPLSRVVDLEGLAAGVITKRNMWQSLRSLTHSGLDADQFDALIERATSQFERLESAHALAAGEAFAPTAPAPLR